MYGMQEATTKCVRELLMLRFQNKKKTERDAFSVEQRRLNKGPTSPDRDGLRRDFKYRPLLFERFERHEKLDSRQQVSDVEKKTTFAINASICPM